LEHAVTPDCTVADIGTGSGILAVAALRLGARFAVATDTDRTSLDAAIENFGLNAQAANVVLGSADCLRDECADVTVANISGTVLLAIMDELLRIAKSRGHLILTGFPEWEIAPFQQLFREAAVTGINEWRCLSTPVC
jgi:ribosomal protein L11 methyltransferase